MQIHPARHGVQICCASGPRELLPTAVSQNRYDFIGVEHGSIVAICLSTKPYSASRNKAAKKGIQGRQQQNNCSLKTLPSMAMIQINVKHIGCGVGVEGGSERLTKPPKSTTRDNTWKVKLNILSHTEAKFNLQDWSVVR